VSARWQYQICYLVKGAVINAYKVWDGKSKGKMQLGKCQHRWENMKMDYKEIEECVNWVSLAQDREQ
jgi:hypothetical protein